MSEPANTETMTVQQIKEWGEILSGFETKNKYAVKNSQGEDVFYAAEVGGSWFMRMFLTSARPFTIHLVTPDNEEILRVERPFRFIFHKADVLTPSGKLRLMVIDLTSISTAFSARQMERFPFCKN